MNIVFLLMTKQFRGHGSYGYDYTSTRTPTQVPFTGQMWPSAILKELTRRGHQTTLVVLETPEYVRSHFLVERVAEFRPQAGFRIVYCADYETVRTVLRDAQAIVIRNDYPEYGALFSEVNIGGRPTVLIMAGVLSRPLRFVPACREFALLVNSEMEVSRFTGEYPQVEMFQKPAWEIFYEPPPEGTDKRYDVVTVMWNSSVPHKRIDLLLDALVHLNALTERTLVVALAGRTSAHAERIAYLAAALPKIEIVRLGQLKRPDVRTVYQRARLCVVPSSEDANPAVIAESLACNVPVACAADITGGRFQITPHTGELFLPHAESLANTIWQMLGRIDQYHAAAHCITIAAAADQVERLIDRRDPPPTGASCTT